MPPPTVAVTESVAERIPIYGEYVGQTESSLYVEMRARVDGFLEKRLFEEGTLVEKGAPLFQIDAGPYKARLDRVKAQLERARAQLAKAERDVARLKPLYEQDAASQMDYDNAVAAVEEMMANVMGSEAELEEAELELSYTSIKAPMTGLIGESEVDIGGLVGSQGASLLTTIRRIDPIHVRFSITALEYLRLRQKKEALGDFEKEIPTKSSVSITLPDGTDYDIKGDVAFTAPQVNPKTGSLALRAVLSNPDGDLRPGQYTRVRLRLGWLPEAVLVPQQAVQVDLGGPYVVVVGEDQRAERRFVALGQIWEDRVVVEGGLDAGERVIVEGMHKVRPGMEVEIVSEDSDKEGGPESTTEKGVS
jgi:membrane fusion protein (multidrug efflux system)